MVRPRADLGASPEREGLTKPLSSALPSPSKAALMAALPPLHPLLSLTPQAPSASGSPITCHPSPTSWPQRFLPGFWGYTEGSGWLCRGDSPDKGR